MKVRTAIASATAAALIAGGGATVLAFPGIASARITTHTLKFISVQKQMHIFSSSALAQQDNDVNSAGKVIGYDELNIVFNLKTGKGTANVALDINGGLLFGTLPVAQSSAPEHGVVTGGVGKFKGASGTILSKPANKAGTKFAITITYHT
ncbi:MAG TPA: hypothetical protein VEV63_00450 [Streptosporangiaceae bacterium]|nr:hypothetical protein [Streptosporangiaceae bacterium]